MCFLKLSRLQAGLVRDLGGAQHFASAYHDGIPYMVENDVVMSSRLMEVVTIHLDGHSFFET
jgi:hypothetical protein